MDKINYQTIVVDENLLCFVTLYYKMYFKEFY